MTEVPPENVSIDSNMSVEDAIAQNPESEAPLEVLEKMKLLSVTYYGFDGELHQGQIVVHEEVVSDVEEFFKRALDIKFLIESVVPISNKKYAWDDSVSGNSNNSSAFNYREKIGKKELSKHATGHAFDINPLQNPYFRTNDDETVTKSPELGSYDVEVPGTLHENHPLVHFMRSIGWTWGGDWDPEDGPVDYQHFEK